MIPNRAKSRHAGQARFTRVLAGARRMHILRATVIVVVGCGETLSSQADGGETKAQLISMSPSVLYEVPAGNYMQAPGEIGEVQVFYAPTVFEEGSDGIKIRASQLEGAEVGIVFPYNDATWHQEMKERKKKYAWGSLDVYSALKKDISYWRRPSVSFYGQVHLSNKNGKLPTAFWTKWYTNLSEESQKLIKSEKIKKALSGAEGSLTVTPWKGMLDFEYKGSSVFAYLPNRWSKYNEWVADKKKGHPNWYLHYVYIRKKVLKNSPKEKKIAWEEGEDKQILNTTGGSTSPHGGLLMLGGRECWGEDFAKGERDTEGKAGYRLVPFCAAYAVGETDEPTEILKAYVLAGAFAPMPCYVLAVVHDWIKDDETAEYPANGLRENDVTETEAGDALSVNKGFSTEAGLREDRLVPKPEYCCVDRANFKVVCDYDAPSIVWQGASSGELNYELPNDENISTVAYMRKQKNVRLKAVVVIPEEVGMEDIRIVAENRYIDLSGAFPGMDTQGTVPLNVGFKQKAVKPLQGAERSVFTIKHPKRPKDTTKYKLYEVEMSTENTTPHEIRRNRMELVWKFYENGRQIGCDYTLHPRVYTIFGNSTWTRENDCTKSSNKLGEALIVWDEALQVFFERLFSESVRNRADIKIVHDGELISYEDYDKYETRSFLGAVAIGILSTTRSCAERKDGVWNGKYSLQGALSTDKLHRSIFYLPDMLHDIYKDGLKQKDQRPKRLCFETAYLMAMLPKLIGYPKEIKVWKIDGYHAWSECDGIGYDAMKANLYELSKNINDMNAEQKVEAEKAGYASPATYHDSIIIDKK